MDTEIVDYPHENFSLNSPLDTNSVLFSSRPRISSSESSQEMGANYLVRNQIFSGSNCLQESHGGASNFLVNQVPRPFHRSLSQPPWVMQNRTPYESSSAESAQSDSSRVTREQVSELIKANSQLQSRVEVLEGILKLIAPAGLTPSVSLGQRAALSPAGSLPGSPFLNGPLAASPFNYNGFNGPSLPVLPGSSNEIQLKRVDYPNVKFWYRQDWLNHVKEGGNSTDVGEVVRGKTLMSKGINKTAKYIEGTDGEPVDGYKVRDIRSHARAIWANFQTVGRTPLTWGRADAEIANLFRREMRSKFFEFALCDNDWKADLLATEHYPSWYNNHIKVDDIKAEATDKPTLLAGSKRSTEPPTANHIKRSKKVRNPLLDRKLGTDTGNSLQLSPIILSDSPAFLGAPASSGTSDLSAPPSIVVANAWDMDPASNGASQIAPSLPPFSPLHLATRDEINGMGSGPPIQQGQTHAHLPSDSALPQVPVPFTGIPSLTITVAPVPTMTGITTTSLAPVLVPAAPPSEDPPVAPVPSCTGTMATTPPAPVLVPAAPPSEDPPVAPVPSHTETMATTPPAPVLAPPAVPPPEDPSVAPVPSMTGTMAAPFLVPGPEDSSAAHVPSSAGENEQRASKKGKMRPGSSFTARNLCAQDWCVKYPDGTAAEFKQYYDHEMSNEDKKIYEQRSKEAKAKKRS